MDYRDLNDLSKKDAYPMPDERDVFDKIPRPQSKKEVRQFMGLINWYRDYIPSLSAIAAPLYVLTNKDVMWQWTEECERSFQSLRATSTFGFSRLEDSVLRGNRCVRYCSWCGTHPRRWKWKKESSGVFL